MKKYYLMLLIGIKLFGSEGPHDLSQYPPEVALEAFKERVRNQRATECLILPIEFSQLLSQGITKIQAQADRLEREFIDQRVLQLQLWKTKKLLRERGLTDLMNEIFPENQR